MNHSNLNTQGSTLRRAALFVAVAIALSGCGGEKEKKSGQALASVNGEEVTVLQLNEELQRSNVPQAQQEAARSQLLESLIDRQLLQSEASKEKLDRDPKVMQAIERAKALIVAQSYLQKKVGTIARPTKAEIEQYYQQHPEFFSQRKQLDMRQIILATADLSEPVKTAIDAAKSLDEVAAWLDAHKIRYARNQVVRSTSDLPSELGSRLVAMPKGQLFIVKEGERSLLVAISDIKDAPATLDNAAPQIEQFLFNKKSKDAADAEVKRLRSTAKIEYLGKVGPAGAAASASASASAAAPAPVPAPAAPSASETNAANERGVAGLK